MSSYENRKAGAYMDGERIVAETVDVVESQPKELLILVPDEDEHGMDINLMSDFFGLYIEQLSRELSTNVSEDFVDNIPIADLQIINEVVYGAEVVLQGEYEYFPDFDCLPNDIKAKLKKGTYTLGESQKII